MPARADTRGWTPGAAASARAHRAQPEVRVVLERVEDRPLRLRERALGRLPRVGQRAAERGDHERVAVLVERKRAALAAGADHSPRRAGEADEVLGLAAGRAARE